MKPESHLREVTAILAHRMRTRRPQDDIHGVVFILGAGCSMQYGLPGFEDLLRYLYMDIHNEPAPQGLSMKELRERLDRFWRYCTPNDSQGLLRPYLCNVQGRHCPAYLCLAKIARKGLVRAIVNMNFDRLLHEAMAIESVNFKYASQWELCQDADVTIITPHGSLARPEQDIILDIARSNLFDEKSNQEAARKFFAGFDVVTIGYAGGDSTITQALALAKAGRKASAPPSRLFVINPSPPNPQLLHALSQRRSADLYVTGSESTFESFVFELYRHIPELPPARRPSAYEPFKRRYARFSHPEQQALESCRRLTLHLRSTLNVAESSELSLEDHAIAIFDTCNELARACGSPLTSVERYLIHCAAYLHDLGYFAAYSGVRRAKDKAGLSLLRNHGALTAKLLLEHLKCHSKWKSSIFPASYDPRQREQFIDALVLLCKYHSFTYLPKDDLDVPSLICVDDYKIPFRFRFIHAIFTAAEELSEGHPFMPSPYQVEETAGDATIEDPVLDFYLEQKHREVTFRAEPWRIIASVKNVAPGQTEPRHATLWFCILAKNAVDQLNAELPAESRKLTFEIEISEEHLDGKKGEMLEELDKQRFVSHLQNAILERLDPGNDVYEALLCDAMEEMLQGAMDKADSLRVGKVPAILDLLAIYTLSVNREEPRVDIRCSKASTALSLVTNIDQKPFEGLLLPYFQRKMLGSPKGEERMTQALFDTFERIYHPAWRFCADSWRAGNDPICMARASLDLGSSSFRGEVVSGLRFLADDKVEWEDENREDSMAFGHERCMLCTSRLLYILSHARLLFPTERLNAIASDFKGRLPAKVHRSLLGYMRSLEPSDRAWWGVGSSIIRSADYIAWAARSLAFAVSVDHFLERHGDPTDKPWIGAERGSLVALLQALLREMAKAGNEALLSRESEEIHAHILGEVGMAYLSIQRLHHRFPELGLLDGLDLRAHAKPLGDAVARIPDHSHLSRFFLWPARVFLHSSSTNGQSSDLGLDLVSTLKDCIDSPIWMTTGTGLGSWGSNLENTQRLASSLNSFWQHAIENGTEFAPLFDQVFADKENPARQDKARRTRKKGEVSTRAVLPEADSQPEESPAGLL